MPLIQLSHKNWPNLNCWSGFKANPNTIITSHSLIREIIFLARLRFFLTNAAQKSKTRRFSASHGNNYKRKTWNFENYICCVRCLVKFALNLVFFERCKTKTQIIYWGKGNAFDNIGVIFSNLPNIRIAEKSNKVQNFGIIDLCMIHARLRKSWPICSENPTTGYPVIMLG